MKQTETISTPLEKSESASVTHPDPSDHYVTRQREQLLRRHTGTRVRRLKHAEALDTASQFQLMVARFRKHRVATISFYLLVVLYVVAIFADFFAPYDPLQRFDDQIYASPTPIHLLDSNGTLTFPFVYSAKSQPDAQTFAYKSVVDDEKTQYRIALFVQGSPYKLLGFIPLNIHLFGTIGGKPLFVLGADNLGRDLLTRIIFAARVSLFIGLVGVFLSFVLGIILGGISGYFGGIVDMVIQRVIELLLSIPQIPLWIALSAAVPHSWTGIQVFFAITVILSLVGWTGLARVVRGKIVSLREEDYVMAARISSASDISIIYRHLLPGFTSYLIVYITLAIPGMILGETALSFLGLGIVPPDISWGSLLQQAQDVTVVATYPWILAPVAFVMFAVILYNFIGDGLRDAADPYSR